jgi:hypothetical protein
MKFNAGSIILLLAGNVALSASAQSVPPLVNYQGRLSNPDGSPLTTADYQLSVSIYDATNGGNLIWGPQIFDGTAGQGHGPKIPVVQGYFNLLLGPGDTANRVLSDAFTNSGRFVQITIGTNAPILPRQQILSAPYAFQAGNSTRLAGADWSALFGINDPVNGKLSGSRIQDNTLGAAQIANGAITGLQIAPGTIQGTNLAASAITQTNLALRAITTNNLSPGIGEVSFSPGLPQYFQVGAGGNAAGTEFIVPGLGLSLNTIGRPVLIMLQPFPGGDRGNGSGSVTCGVGGSGVINVYRDSILIRSQALPSTPAGSSFTIPFSLAILDAPTPGSHGYDVRLKWQGAGYGSLINVQLVAIEL